MDSSKDDFEDGNEVYEAIGEVLMEVGERGEDEVRWVVGLEKAEEMKLAKDFAHLSRQLQKNVSMLTRLFMYAKREKL